MTSQVRMTIVIRTGEGNTPKVTPDRFSPATRAAEVDEANRTRAGAPLRGAVIAYRITRRIITGRGAQLYLQFPWSWELRNGWIEWNVHRDHSPLGPNQQTDYGSHLCDRKERDREGEFI